MSHVTVERNRRRQMNDHLKVLRSLTPPFYIKKGDQASIIGGVIDFIQELHQVAQSLESQKRRKSLSPTTPLPSPRLLGQQQQSPSTLESSSNYSNNKELVACCNSSVADVEAKISGSNVILKIVSHCVPGQLVKIINLLEKLEFEIVYLNISTMEDTVLYSFEVKIGLACQLSVEELVSVLQQSFST